MRVFSPSLLFVFFTAAAAQTTVPPAPASPMKSAALSERVLAALKRADQEIARTELGRRLLAATEETRIVEKRDRTAAAVRYSHERQALVLNPDKLLHLQPEEAELTVLRERERASVNISVPLVEDEQAAYQTEIEYALEKAAAAPEFDVWLRSAYQRAQTEERSRRLERERLRAAGVEPGPESDARTPHGAMVRLGLYLYLFSEDPDEFYWIVERDQVRGPAVRFMELSDFMDLHGRQLSELNCPEHGRYCWLGGRSYPRRVGSAALATQDAAGLRRVREGVGIFQTKALPVLRQAVNRWVRGKG